MNREYSFCFPPQFIGQTERFNVLLLNTHFIYLILVFFFFFYHNNRVFLIELEVKFKLTARMISHKMYFSR